MTSYTAPLDDMRFAMRELGLLQQVAALPGCHEASEELVEAVLEEAGKLAANVVAPLNAVGDRQGATLENGVVRVADGFAEAYRSYVDGGWNGKIGRAHDRTPATNAKLVCRLLLEKKPRKKIQNQPVPPI